MAIRDWFSKFRILDFPEEEGSPARYRVLRRNMIILMLLATIVPLTLMALVDYHQYQTTLKQESISPLSTLVNKTRYSFELFLAQQLSIVGYLASAYTFDELADENTLNRVFRIAKHEFGGFVDLGLDRPTRRTRPADHDTRTPSGDGTTNACASSKFVEDGRHMIRSSRVGERWGGAG